MAFASSVFRIALNPNPYLLFTVAYLHSPPYLSFTVAYLHSPPYLSNPRRPSYLAFSDFVQQRSGEE
ncbi:unnamed protein product [Lathyrus oleraceus]